jgi:hypothetical protein
MALNAIDSLSIQSPVEALAKSFSGQDAEVMMMRLGAGIIDRHWRSSSKRKLSKILFFGQQRRVTGAGCSKQLNSWVTFNRISPAGSLTKI